MPHGLGRLWGNGMTAKVLWDVVRHPAAEGGGRKPFHDIVAELLMMADSCSEPSPSRKLM
jgi:hypothetical protein